MVLCPDDADRLRRLQAQYDDLLAGRNVTKVQFGQRVIEKGKGDLGALKAEIDGLLRKSGRGRGAIGFRL